MKKLLEKINGWKLFISMTAAFLLTLILPSFGLFQKFDAQAGTLMLGFPSYFYSIHIVSEQAGKFGIHFHIGGFLINIAVFYILVNLIFWGVKRLRNSIKNKAEAER